MNLVAKVLIVVVGGIGIALMPFMGIAHSTILSDMSPEFRGKAPGEYFQNRLGLWLYTRSWEVEDPKAIIVIHHGYGEDSAKYAEVADAFNKQGWSVFSYDAQGHGLSEGDRMYFMSYQHLIDDLAHFTSKIKSKHKSLPCFGLGHSNGGMVTMETSIQMPKLFKGIILSAPLLRDSVELPLEKETLLKIAAPLAKYLPKLALAHLDLSTISRNQTVVENARADPNFPASRPIPVRVAHECFKMCAKRDSKKGLAQIKKPYLLLHGTDDRLIKLEGSEAIHAQSKSKDKTLKTYDGLYHEVLMEDERHEVIADIVEWVAERV